jgi:UDP-glucuronate decarboxylase
MRHPIIESDLQYITKANLEWEIFNNKTIFISGANGFLPAYMVETFLYLQEVNIIENIKIIALARDKEKALNRFRHYKERNSLEFICQDVCQPILVDRKIDYIIHAASQASPKFYSTDPAGTMSANILGTNNLLELSRRNNSAGFLFFSSSEIYGQVNEFEIPTAENIVGKIDPLLVRSCYAESKRAGETLCVSWSHQYGVPAKIIRPFHTYGPGVSLNDGRVFADFIADIINNRNIKMTSDGTAMRSFCYIADATIGFFKVLIEGKISEAYNIGNPKAEISILNLAKALVDLFPDKNLQVIEDISNEDSGYIKSTISRNCPDISKMQLLGWEPNIDIPNGFKKTVDWHRFLPILSQ